MKKHGKTRIKVLKRRERRARRKAARLLQDGENNISSMPGHYSLDGLAISRIPSEGECVSSIFQEIVDRHYDPDSGCHIVDVWCNDALLNDLELYCDEDWEKEPTTEGF